jgi:predicted Zn-dependent protease
MDRRAFIKTTVMGGASLFLPNSVLADSTDHLIQLVPLELTAYDEEWPIPYHESLITGIEKYFKARAAFAADSGSKMYVGDANARIVLDALEEVRSEHSIGLTSAPLTLPNRDISGYAFTPGNAAIITTYWRCRNVPLDVALHRLLGLALHELSHNFGIDHCNDHACIMYDDLVPRKSYDVPHTWCKPHSEKISSWLR